MTGERRSPTGAQVRNVMDHLLGRCVCGPVWKCSTAPLADSKKDTP